jgi:cytoskeletal protein CcmA (bactofilin family)
MTKGSLRTLILAVAVSAIGITSAPAQDDGGRYRFGDDLFAAGNEVRVTEQGLQDVFAAGETVRVESSLTETLHAAGREVQVLGAVGGDFYGAGYEIEIDGTVSGDAVAAGYRVGVAPGGTVGGDVLFAGRNVEVRGAVAGNASLAGETVEVAAPITGSVEIRARNIRFAEGARIDGTLAWWSTEEVEVPATVIAADRVSGHTIARDGDTRMPFGVAAYIVGGLLFFAAVLIVAALFAWIFPGPLQRSRAVLVGHPWWTFFLGVIVTSACFGSIIVFAASLIAIPLVPAAIILLPFALLIGYLTSAHAIGASLLRRVAPGPSGIAAFAAMLVGLIILALVGLIPILGWVLAVLAAIFGLGMWAALLVVGARSEAQPA